MHAVAYSQKFVKGGAYSLEIYPQKTEIWWKIRKTFFIQSFIMKFDG